MTSPMLVTGGTGMLGSLAVPRLRNMGRDVRLLSRNEHASEPGVQYVTGDLVKGEGIEAAVAGSDTILHLAGGPKGDDVAMENLVRAAAAAGGTPHVVFASVTAADKLPIGYFRAKAKAEQTLAESGLPHTTLRVAQTHPFVLDFVQKMTKMPIVPVPSAIRFQPVDSDETAARLVELSLGDPAGRVADFVGPEVHAMPEFVRSYLDATGSKRWVVGAPLPGKVGKAYKDGENLTLEGAQQGTVTWEDFLATRLS